ncbi:MAG: FAD/NAD(P)-binding oxidoreductase [Paracoccaceae bacterium]
MSNRLDGATITIIDDANSVSHQPRFTLIAAGLQTAKLRHQPNGRLAAIVSELDPEEFAARIDPDANRITTVGGTVVDYDYLVVATGLSLDWDAIEGFSLDQVGQNGNQCPLCRPQYAELSWRALDRFTDTGGVGRPVALRPG